MNTSNRPHHEHVLLFYRYFLASPNLSSATLTHFRQNSSFYLPLLQQHQSRLCHELGSMKGRILLSTEGINGTLSCHTKEELKEYVDRMERFDLIGELGSPLKKAASLEVVPDAGQGRLFANIDWKTSTTATNSSNTSNTTQNCDSAIDPFPDLKIQIVKEIVNTGGAIHVDDIPMDTGKEISAEEFHAILLDAQQSGSVDDTEDANNDNERAKKKHRVDDDGTLKQEKKEVVLIDVRNTFEHAIGHFVHPTCANTAALLDDTAATQSESGQSKTNDSVVDDNNDDAITTKLTATTDASTTRAIIPAINPNTVTFSHFDSTFCSQNSESLKNKKVLMYCTGGIRCIKASAMLKQRGVEDVSHLSGGIHRYLEKYGREGFYKGKVFVFDQRVALDAGDMLVEKEQEGGGGECLATGEMQQKQQQDVVGKCIECNIPYDEISGANLCTVCRDLILICPSCHEKIHEFHCDRHQSWKGAYFTFLERFTAEELTNQKGELQSLHDSYLPPKKHKNVRRTLRKQMEKIDTRLRDIQEGNVSVELNAKRRCRTCFESSDICDGRCWGFWKHSQSPHNYLQSGGSTSNDGKTLEPIQQVKVGDRVTIGPNWNEIRLGSRGSPNDPRVGTVVDIKSWASGGDELDCVAVQWDKSVDCSRKRKTSGVEELQQSEIYRWGVVARNGQRMYDVCKFITGYGGSTAR